MDVSRFFFFFSFGSFVLLSLSLFSSLFPPLFFSFSLQKQTKNKQRRKGPRARPARHAEVQIHCHVGQGGARRL